MFPQQQTPPWQQPNRPFTPAPAAPAAPLADPNDALMVGAAGAPAAQFVNPGDVVSGTVLTIISRQERDYMPARADGSQVPFSERPLSFFRKSGDPIMGIVLTIQTDARGVLSPEDDGVRTLFIEGKRKKDAVRAALLAAGAKGIEVGARIDMQWGGKEPPYAQQSPNIWNARYVPAAQVQASAALTPAAPAAQVAPQQPVSPWAQQPAAPAAPWAPAAAPAGPATAPPWATQG